MVSPLPPVHFLLFLSFVTSPLLASPLSPPTPPPAMFLTLAIAVTTLILVSMSLLPPSFLMLLSLPPHMLDILIRPLSFSQLPTQEQCNN